MRYLAPVDCRQVGEYELIFCTILNQPFMNRLCGLFHKKIYLLWNRPESLLRTMVQYLSMDKLNDDTAYSIFSVDVEGEKPGFVN
ncbi:MULTISPECIES: hypothetical protein [unclassified Microcoleus]|uniref:hypothetical protein n=1 Tax=unclassified Microcoleus TaxID=2642155 RepID=UPI002FCF4EA5